MTTIQPWPAGSVCPEDGYADFAKALNDASYHYADDSGKEWGRASACMERAVNVAVNSAWPYWVMKRMHKEIAPLPSFDSFMEAYCKRLLADAQVAA